jgi:hypothetical protein
VVSLSRLAALIARREHASARRITVVRKGWSPLLLTRGYLPYSQEDHRCGPATSADV